jgi:hypothetical protein
MINTPPLGPIQARRYDHRGGYGVEYNIGMWYTFTDKQRSDILDNYEEP